MLPIGSGIKRKQVITLGQTYFAIQTIQQELTKKIFEKLLIKAIDDYIYYYNYDRIKMKLKGLSPVNYRLQSSN